MSESKRKCEILKGVIPPVVTPVDEREHFDEEGMRGLIDYLMGAGVHGVFVNGSTGECATLTERESRRAIECAIECVNGRLPVFVGASDTGTRRVIEKIKFVEKVGGDAAVVTPPYYFSCDDSGLIDHYLRIADESEVPIVIYNIPQNTKLFVNLRIVESLSRHENIIGIKDSSRDFVHFQDMVFEFRGRDDFSILQGCEALSAVSLFLGADGLVSGIGNLDPRGCVGIYDACVEGNYRRALELQEKQNALMEIYRYGSWVGAIKVGLELLGICGGAVTRPFPEVPPEGIEAIKAILGEQNLLAD